jgi:hypothetical protein
MDRVIYYDYVLGTFKDIIERNEENLDIFDSPLDITLDETLNSSKIILPKFMGVYQNWEIKADNKEEEGYLEEAVFNEEKQLNDIHMKDYWCLKECNEEDLADPELIHLSYDPKIYEDITQFIPEPTNKRILISPYDKLPDFDNKNTGLEQMFLDKIVDLIEEPMNNGPNILRRFQNICSEINLELSSEWKKFGLNLSEYVTMKSLDTMKNSNIEGVEMCMKTYSIISQSISQYYNLKNQNNNPDNLDESDDEDDERF